MAQPKRRTSAAQRDLNDREHVLYRFWDAHDVLLYVGISVDSPTRIANHMRDKPWWGDVETIKFTKYPNRKAALEAEAEMIRTLKPLHNVIHNEMVEDAEVTDEGDILTVSDLPRIVLSELDSEDRNYVLRENREDWEGIRRSDEDAELRAAIDAVSGLSYDRRRFLDLIRELMGYLSGPEDETDGYLGLAEHELREWHEGGHVSEFDIARVALNYYVDFRARRYLALLGPEQAEAWRERTKTIRGETIAAVDRFAARDARAWHVSGWYDKRGCCLTGPRGALCPRRVSARLWYEVCLFCTPGQPCDGHELFCAEHAEQAADGDLRFIEQSRLGAFPVLRWERLDSELEESPF